MSDDQFLFLIEFLVDRVNVPTVRAINENILPSTTYVSFQVLNLPAINIYQYDTSGGFEHPEDSVKMFRKGKSCLFALPACILEKPLYSFPIVMSVYKKLPAGVLPDVLFIGNCTIEMKNLINRILWERVFNSGNSCNYMKNTFNITTPTGQLVGDVTVFIRASCFGKKIITQFELPKNNSKTYLFKGTDGSPIIACKRIPSVDDKKQPVLSSLTTNKKRVDISSNNPHISCICRDNNNYTNNNPHRKYHKSLFDYTKSSMNKNIYNNNRNLPYPPPTTPTELLEQRVVAGKVDVKKCGCH